MILEETFVSKTWIINSRVFSKGTQVPCIWGCQGKSEGLDAPLLQGNRRKIKLISRCQ